MATKTFNTRVANKRDTSSNWTTNNPVLLNGEIIIVDTEAGQVRYKVGNGTSTYTQLPFTDESLITNINGKLSLTGGTMTGNIAMGGHKVTGLGAPVDSNDAVRQADLKVVSDEVDGIIAGTTAITLPIADDTKLGGVKIGEGVNVAEDGTISVTPELPTGGTAGQVLTKTADGSAWEDAPSGLPDGGVEGQMLYKSADGAVWADKPESGLTQEQADERYLQLTGGTLTGDLNLSAYGDTITIHADEKRHVLINCETLSVGDRIGGVNYVLTTGTYRTSYAPKNVTITLSSSGWSSNTQTVTVSGVVASETAQLITPTPAVASQSAYYEAGIMCTGQAANSLTFTCQTVPTSNLTVYVVIQPLS